jgi:hypothetical protein
MRLRAGIGYVTPNDEHEGRGPAIRKARQARTRAGSPPAACMVPRAPAPSTIQGARRFRLIDPRSIADSETGQAWMRAAWYEQQGSAVEVSQVGCCCRSRWLRRLWSGVRCQG